MGWQYMTVTVRKHRMSRFCFLLTFFVMALTMVLIKTAVQRYHNMKKYFRLQEYAAEVRDITESLALLEDNAVSLEEEMAQLKKLSKDVFQQLNGSVSMT